MRAVPIVLFLLLIVGMVYCMVWMGQHVGPASEAIAETILKSGSL